MRLSTTTIQPVRKQRRVPLEPARAFELFTDSMATWWPLRTHSIGEEAATGRVQKRTVDVKANAAAAAKLSE